MRLIKTGNENVVLIELRCYSEESQSHSHGFHQLVLPVSGHLELEIDGVSGKVSNEHAAGISAENYHAFSADEANQFIVANVPAAWEQLLNNLPAFLALSPTLKSYINFIHSSLKKDAFSQLTQEHILMLLLEIMSEQMHTNIKIDKRITLAKAYLDDHISTSVSLNQVAFAAHLSIRQLSELFKLQLGLTPLQYLREKRMQQAVLLLSQTSLPIERVAQAVGYQSLSAFSTRFHQYYGRTARYFRQNNKKQSYSSKNI